MSVFDNIVDFFKNINDTIQSKKNEKNFNVCINGTDNNIIHNGKVLGDKIEILSKQFELEKDFKISISYDGNIGNISTAAGNIVVNTVDNTDIKMINSVSGDIKVNGNIQGNSDFKTTSGDISINGDVGNENNISSVSGDISIKGSAKNVSNIKSTSGNLKL